MFANPVLSTPAPLRRPKTKSSTKARKQRRQMVLESLESRTLLSYTFTGGGTNMGVATGDGSADTLYLEPFSGLIYHSTDGIVFSPDWGGGLTIAASTANSISVFQGNAANAHAVRLGGVLGPVSDLQAHITTNDGGPLDSLVVDDSLDNQQAVGANAYTVTSTSVTGPPTLNVGLNGPALGAGLTLLGGTADNTFNVNSTQAGTTTTINGGANTNTYNLSNDAEAGGLDNLPGPVVINGGGTSDFVRADDFDNGANYNYTVTSTTVTNTGLFGGLTYGGLGAGMLSLLASGGSNVIDVDSTANGVSTTVYGDQGVDTIDVNGTGTGSTLFVYTGDFTDEASTVNVLANSELVFVKAFGLSPAITTVNIGSTGGPGTMAGIQGPITVINNGSGYSLASLNCHDENDTTGQTATLLNDGTNGQVTGLSPATINYVNANTDSLTVHGGSAATRSPSMARSSMPPSPIR